MLIAEKHNYGTVSLETLCVIKNTLCWTVDAGGIIYCIAKFSIYVIAPMSFERDVCVY